MSSESHAEKILTLEKEIAYFFGVQQPELVGAHYIEAVKLLEMKNHLSDQELKIQMLVHIEAAYAEVKKQTNFDFDVKKAASYEFDLFIANCEQAPFEKEFALLVNIYHEVFGSITHEMRNAALLRTFLYRYKNQLMSSGEPLSHDDIAFLKLIAAKTEFELSAFTKGSASHSAQAHKQYKMGFHQLPI